MNMTPKTVALCAAALASACAGAYDIHLKSLTPVKELAKPSGAAMKFVENGELRFCVALDPKAETRVKNRTQKSIAPALVHLTNAIFRTTGKVPEVVDEADAAALEKHRYWLVLGDSKLARKAGRGNEVTAQKNGKTAHGLPLSARRQKRKHQPR